MYNKKFWKQFLIALALFLAGWFTFGHAQAQGKPEKTKVTIAVGGKNLFYYLPLTIAERQGYFKDEGLDVEIVDFAGGAKALQAVVGGSADVVSGAYEHTITCRPRASATRNSCCRAGRRRSCWWCRTRPCPTSSRSPT